MTIRLSAAYLEALVKASEIPKPLDLPTGASGGLINPMLFHHDWSVECSLETRWLTDVSSSITQHEDRWALSSRPSRRLSVRIVGPTKLQSDAILQSQVAMATSFGFPVPLYPDAVLVKSFEISTLRAYGDFRYRRFFVGGRVAVIPQKLSHLQSSVGVFFLRIAEVTPSSIVVSLDPQSPFRPVVPGDTLVPCMDAELLEESSGTALTDSVYTCELEWNEIDGPSALPALWPAISSDDASDLSPICSVVDGKALFPFLPDWSDGVEVTVRRLVDSQNMGRTSAQDFTGRPFLAFELSVMGYDRAACWKVARFFDAMRARWGHFYFAHPQRPWTLDSFLGPDSCRISAAGNIDVLSNTKRVLFTADDGEVQVRQVVGITEVSGLFQLTLDSDLPHTDFTAIDPVYVCRFEDDVLVEGWSTDGVIPSLVLKIIEDASGGEPASFAGSIAHTDQYTAYTTIPDLQLLFKAGAECYSRDPVNAAGSGTNGKPSQQHPSYFSIVEEWRNIHKVGRAADIKLVDSATHKCRLINWLSPYKMNGQPGILNCRFNMPFQTDASVPLDDRTLWSVENGWTLFICLSPLKWEGTPVTRELFSIETPELRLWFNYDETGAPAADDTSRARLWQLRAGFPATMLPLSVPIANYGAGAPIDRYGPLPTILTIRAGGSNDGNSLRIWVNGRQAANLGNLVLSNPSSYSHSRWFAGMNFTFGSGLAGNSSNYIGFTTNEILTAWQVWPAAHMLVSYKRALNVTELNQVLTTMSETFFGTVSEATIF